MIRGKHFVANQIFLFSHTRLDLSVMYSKWNFSTQKCMLRTLFQSRSVFTLQVFSEGWKCRQSNTAIPSSFFAFVDTEEGGC